MKYFLRFVAVLLLLAAFSKLRHPEPFAHSLAMYGFFPDWSLRPLAYFVPALELLVGVRLLFLSRAGVVWALLLFVAFSFSIGIAWATHHSLSCGCFGRLDSGLHRVPHGVFLHLVVNCLVTGGLAYAIKPSNADPQE